MAHPYKGHSENAVGKRRAQKMMSGSEYKRGGAVHSDAPQDRKLINQVLREHERKEGEGRATGGRVMTAGAESGVGRLQKAHGAGVRK